MGSSKKQTVGYWYHPRFHLALCQGPVDALLKVRGGEVDAWTGEVTTSSTIRIEAEGIWGGEESEGGIKGPLDVMMGEADQPVNGNVSQLIGPDPSAHRGVMSVLFGTDGSPRQSGGGIWDLINQFLAIDGRYGAMNPYPKPISFQVRRILEGWGEGGCWYPEKAAISLIDGDVFTSDMAFPATSASIDGMYAGLVLDSGFTPQDVLIIDKPEGLTYQAWSPWASDADPNAAGKPWRNAFRVTNGQGTMFSFWGEGYPTASEAKVAAAGQKIYLGGSSSYRIWLYDTPVTDNRGGLSLRIRRSGLLGMNPAHMIYDALIDHRMRGEPVEFINDLSFRSAADKLFSEGFGLCTSYDPDRETVDQFIGRICKVIGAQCSRSTTTGEWHLDLIRGDYDPDALPVLTDDDILEFEDEPSVLDDAVNQVAVKWFDPVTKQSRTTPAVHSLAAIQAMGAIAAQVLEYPEIPEESLACRVADRELLDKGTPLWRKRIKTNRVPYSWRIGTYFRLQAPKNGVADMVCLVGDIDKGTLRSGAIDLVALQDIFGMPASSIVSAQPPLPTPDRTPVAAAAQLAFEAPYIELASTLPNAELAALDVTSGFLQFVAARPSTGNNYQLRVAPSGSDYVIAGLADWCPTALVVEASGYNDEAFTLADGSLVTRVAVGTPALWGNEIVRVDALDVEIGAVTLGRACADTVAVRHAAGERIWFYGDWASSNNIEYALAEEIDAIALTRTGTGMLAEDAAPVSLLAFDQRAARPYPPARLTINGDPGPAAVVGSVDIAWRHRDRILQADQVIDQSVGDIGPEPGTTYTVRCYLNSVLDNEQTGITGTSTTWAPSGAGMGRVEVCSVRDGLKSWQVQAREFALGNPLQAEVGSLISTEDGQPILME